VTIVAHREVALDEVAECGVEVKRARFAIVDELVLDHVPDLTRGDTVLLGDVLKFADDHAEDPGEDGGLHAIPGRVIDTRSVGEDMVVEFVALQGEQNLIMPVGVAYRRMIQNSRYKRVNVLYPVGLHVEHGDDGSVTPRGWGWWRSRGGGSGQPHL
jgi:hypothetical protein